MKIIDVVMWMLIWINVRGFYFDISGVAFHDVQPLTSGALSVRDYDKDGLLDFLAGGSSPNGNRIFLFRQNYSLSFYDVTNGVTFPGGAPTGFQDGPGLFADIDSDGSLDFFYAGTGLANAYFQLSPSIFSLNTSAFSPAGLIGTTLVNADFGDYNNDGRLDLLYIGDIIPFTMLRQGLAGGFLNAVSNASFPTGMPPSSMNTSWIAWRDVDNDGRLDFGTVGIYIAQLYRQNVSGIFYNVWNAASFPANPVLSLYYISGRVPHFPGKTQKKYVPGRKSFPWEAGKWEFPFPGFPREFVN